MWEKFVNEWGLDLPRGRHCFEGDWSNIREPPPKWGSVCNYALCYSSETWGAVVISMTINSWSNVQTDYQVLIELGIHVYAWVGYEVYKHKMMCAAGTVRLR